jgi:FixJ family two-component response regulator
VGSGVANVFVVDDDAAVRRALGRLLRSAGYEPKTFASAEGFLKGSHFEAPGCILTDVQLPGLNGLELQQTLANANRHLAFIFITGHGDIPMSVQAMKAGAVDFLSKPFDNEELLQSVAQALNKSRREQSEQEEVAEISRRLSTLTAREHEVLCHIVSGQLNKQAAAELGIVEKTIKVHRARVMDKMGTSSLAELVTMAARTGLHAPLHLNHCSSRIKGDLRLRY